MHSSENVSEEGRRRRTVTINQHFHKINRNEKNEKELNDPFILTELVRTINKAKPTSPGKDQICYLMLKQLEERSMLKILNVYNKI